MKFGNLLRERLADLPEYESLFQCYKQLKKKLKSINPQGSEADFGGSGFNDEALGSSCSVNFVAPVQLVTRQTAAASAQSSDSLQTQSALSAISGALSYTILEAFICVKVDAV